MKIYPESHKIKDAATDGLTKTQKTTRLIALVIAFVSVFVFFFKLLFF